MTTQQTLQVRTDHPPSCPTCGARMRLVHPKPKDRWLPFWSCVLFPNCKGTKKAQTKSEIEQADQLSFLEKPVYTYESVIIYLD